RRREFLRLSVRERAAREVLTMRRRMNALPAILTAAFLAAGLLGGAAGSLLGSCGPFSDVSDAAFCPLVLEIFYLGITTGTTPTTYDPSSTVTRLQMAAFLSRTVDSTLKRSSARTRLGRFWTTKSTAALALTTVGAFPVQAASDGLDVWVANFNDS